MDIREVSSKFATDEQCLVYIEQMRWPNGVVRCPQCGAKDPKRIDRKTKSRNKRGWFYLCSEKTCLHQFSPTSGTLFHDTHLPLIVWFHAIALMLNAKKGLSAMQLKRDLRIGGYKTAWYLNHRIREAMREGSLPQMGGIVEIDETYIGGYQKGKGHAAALKNKHIVIGIRERKGPLRFIQAKDTKSKTLRQIIESNLRPDVQFVMTDDSSEAKGALKRTGHAAKHRIINHSIGSYVDGMIHTNTIESAFSLLKRGVIGSFHRLSIKHLQKYLNEFSYRFNRRNDPHAFIETVRRLAGFPPLTFDALTSEKA